MFRLDYIRNLQDAKITCIKKAGIYAVDESLPPGNEVVSFEAGTAAHSPRPTRVLTSGNHDVGHLESKPPDIPKAPQR